LKTKTDMLRSNCSGPESIYLVFLLFVYMMVLARTPSGKNISQVNYFYITWEITPCGNLKPVVSQKRTYGGEKTGFVIGCLFCHPVLFKLTVTVTQKTK